MTDTETTGFFYNPTANTETPPAEYTGGTVGLNPDRADGTWDTPTIAWVAFATQFADLCRVLKGEELFIRFPPTLKEVKSLEVNEPRYVVAGRFAWKKKNARKC